MRALQPTLRHRYPATQAQLNLLGVVGALGAPVAFGVFYAVEFFGWLMLDVTGWARRPRELPAEFLEARRRHEDRMTRVAATESSASSARSA